MTRGVAPVPYLWSVVAVFAEIFSRPHNREKHLSAPLLKEREQYLAYLLQNGVSRQRVRTAGCILLHIIRLLALEQMRMVLASEITEACARWLTDPAAHNTRAVGPHSAESFTGTAVRWFRFHDSLAIGEPVDELDGALQEYLAFQRSRMLSVATVRGLRSCLLYFLSWVRSRALSLKSMKLREVEDYLTLKASDGCKPRSIATIARSLRSFFEYAAERGWVVARFSSAIRSPRVPRYAALPQGPKWKDVRRLLCAKDQSPSAMRAKAMLMLLSIYALRVSELTGLLLDDFDWENETFTVKRAKRGRVQQYPVQFEVGEAIIRYLEHERPLCRCKHLFVTLRPPHRRVGIQTVQHVVADRLKSLGVETQRVGPHALRHACATQLLKRGASLKDIADFLGHRDLRSVSIYAKVDPQLLKKVADFKLGVL